MYIGRLAKLSGCTPKAIRLYEELGLIAKPLRQGRYRVYDDHHVDVVRLIRVAQSAGFKLNELSEMLAEKRRQQRFPLELAVAGINVKREQVRAQIAQLHGVLDRLQALQQEIEYLYAEEQQPGCKVTLGSTTA